VHVALLASRPRLSSRLELQKKGNRGKLPGGKRVLTKA
jgi:hypothetical protein